MSLAMPVEMGWSMSDREFRELRRIIHACSGIVIGPEKHSMIRARLQKRMQALGFSAMSQYLDLLNGPSGRAERNRFISSLTTNFTSFFREAHHFDLLTETILPSITDDSDGIHIWSAGCSSGQEPYSIAMSVLDARPELAAKVKILATDIDATIIDKAKQGIFRPGELSGVGTDSLSRHFTPVAGQTDEQMLRVSRRVSRLVTFQQLNLVSEWSLTQHFHVIFCRNVAIYFDQAAQDRLWRKLSLHLRPGGWLLIGHSERVPVIQHDYLQPSGLTAYRKPD